MTLSGSCNDHRLPGLSGWGGGGVRGSLGCTAWYKANCPTTLWRPRGRTTGGLCLPALGGARAKNGGLGMRAAADPGDSGER